MGVPVENVEKAAISAGVTAEIKLNELIGEVESNLAVGGSSVRIVQLADAYIDIGEYEKAIELCQQSLEQFPFYQTAYLVLGRAYFHTDKLAQGQDVLETFITKFPAHVKAHKWLGDLFKDAGQIKKAVSHYRIALRSDPLNREVINKLLELKEEFKKHDDGHLEEGVIHKPEKVESVEPPKAKKEPVTDELEAKDMGELLFDSKFQQPKIKPADKSEEETIALQKPADDVPVEEAKTPEDSIAPAESKAPATAGQDAVLEELRAKGLEPAHVDEKGMLYFYGDEELTFDQYKLRSQLQQEGKAEVLDRAEMDARLAELKAATAPPTPAEKPVKTKKAKKKSKPPAKKEPAPEPTPEPQISDSEVLSKEDQDALLDELDISYHDYLDILTEEADLIEALFDVETTEQAPAEQEQSDSDPEITYAEYVAGTSDDELIAEAVFKDESDTEQPISLAQYGAQLDQNGEMIDLSTFALFVEDSEMLNEVTNLLGSEAQETISYQDYIAEGSEPTKEDAESLEQQVAELTGLTVSETIEPDAPEVVKEIQPESEPVKIEPEPAIEPEPVVEPEPAARAQVVEEPEEELTSETRMDEAVPTEEEEQDELLTAAEFEEEDLMDRELSLELVDEYATLGKFGSAFKACTLLKERDPSDAKVDRKVLELKRLYIWSTQLIG